MADLRISALTELAAAPATNDLFPLVDVSDTTDAASGTTKKITVLNLFTSPGFTTAANPISSDGASLGTTALMWSDLFLASGSVVNFNNGDVTLTHSANTLTLAGGDLALGANNLTLTGSIGATGARATKLWATDIESTNIPTVGGTAILTSLTAPQFTTIELGHASDTTLSRSAAGIVAVEGVALVNLSTAQTLTNKTLTSPIINTPTAAIITSLTEESTIADSDLVMLYDASATALRKMTKANFVSGLSSGSASLASGAGTDLTAKVYHEDFGENSTARFTLTASGGTASYEAIDDMGYVYLNYGAGASQSAEWYADSKFKSGSYPTIIVEFQLDFNSVPSGATTDWALGAGPTAGQYPGFENDSFGFVFTGGAWEFRTRDGSTTQTDTGLAALSAGYHRVRFEITGSGTTYKCFVNGVQVGTTHTTNVPGITTQLTPRMIGGTTAAGGVNVVVKMTQHREVMFMA